jgi:hypothetical protein
MDTAGPAIWRDKAAQISLGLAVVLNLLLFVLVLLTHQQLEDAVTAAEAAAGPGTGGQYSTLILPIIGLASWLSGGALGAYYYRWRVEAPIAYIIWGAVVLIEVATWVPVLTLIVNP